MYTGVYDGRMAVLGMTKDVMFARKGSMAMAVAGYGMMMRRGGGEGKRPVSKGEKSMLEKTLTFLTASRQIASHTSSATVARSLGLSVRC